MAQQTDQNPRLVYYQQLAKLATGLTGASSDTALLYFREKILPDPDSLRRKILGANILRLRKLNSDQREMLHVLDITPDLLTPLDSLRYEPSHSLLLAYHVNPARSSALAIQCLDALLHTLNITDERKADVKTEHFVADGRVDIRIELPSTLIFVEVKVDAEAGKDQLATYRAALNKEKGSKTGVLVYLTLPGASEPEGAKPDKHITFLDVLSAWIPVASQRCGAHDYLARYLKSIALIVRRAEAGGFEDWSFATQRALLDLIEEPTNG